MGDPHLRLAGANLKPLALPVQQLDEAESSTVQQEITLLWTIQKSLTCRPCEPPG